MEFCKKSKPTIKMRNSSKKEHINCDLFKIKTPGMIQFSVEKIPKPRCWVHLQKPSNQCHKIDVPVQENQLNCTRKVAEMDVAPARSS